MKLAFFRTKPYEKAAFKQFDIQFKYINDHLTEDTAVYAYDCDAACAKHCKDHCRKP